MHIMKKLLSILAVICVLAALTVAVSAADVDVKAEPARNVTVDGVVSSGEYGPPVVNLGGDSFNWLNYYASRNDVITGSKVRDPNLAPDAMKLYLAWDDGGLYVAVEVDTDNFYQQTASTWNFFSHLLLHFENSGWDCLILEPDASGVYNTSRAVIAGTASAHGASRSTSGVTTYEAYYPWNKIRTGGAAPASGDSLKIQMMYLPSSGSGSVYQCYYNPAGTTEAEQTNTAGNNPPLANWFNVTLAESPYTEVSAYMVGDSNKPNVTDGVVSAGEYGAPICTVAGAGKAFWKDYYIKQNGAAASAMNEALMPDNMKLYAAYDAQGLYLAAEVDSDAYYNETAAGWHVYSHLRLYFDRMNTGRWDAISLRPDANGTYNTPNRVMTHWNTTVGASRKDGVTTYEAFYKWTDILGSAPAAGDKIHLQALLMSATKASEQFLCYVNPCGSTTAEQETGAGNVYPVSNWFEITLLAEVTDLTVNADNVKKEYTEGEAFDPTGLVVTATVGGVPQTLSASDYAIVGGSSLSYGQTSVTVSYMGKTVAVTGLTVKASENYTHVPFIIKDNTFVLDGNLTEAEYGPAVLTLAPDDWASYWDNGGAGASYTDTADETVMPARMELYYRGTDEGMYVGLKVVVPSIYTEYGYNVGSTTAGWNWHTNFALLFKSDVNAATYSRIISILKHDASGVYNTPFAFQPDTEAGAKANALTGNFTSVWNAAEKTVTYENFYKWESIMPDGQAPADGDAVALQILYQPAAEGDGIQKTVRGYINMAGTTAAEQTSANWQIPGTKWIVAHRGTQEATPAITDVTFTAAGDTAGTLTFPAASGYKYRVNNGEWVEITAQTVPITGLSDGAKIYIAKCGNGQTTVDSEPSAALTVTSFAAPAIADITVTHCTDANNGAIAYSGASALEFRTAGNGDWAPISAASSLYSGVYEIRTAASGASLASAPVSVEIIARVTSIAVNSTAHKTEYFLEDPLDVSGLTIFVKKADGSEYTMPVTPDMVTGFDSTQIWMSCPLTITLDGKTTTYNVSVQEYRDTQWENIVMWMFFLHSRSYEISAAATDGGSISPDGIVKVRYNKSQTYEITPEEGYTLKSVIVDGVDVGPVTEYTFNNVKEKHTISAVFEKFAWESPFADISGTEWFVQDVAAVYEAGLMGGMDAETFAPDAALTRAAAATSLWRLAGKPDMAESSASADALYSGDFTLDGKITDGEYGRPIAALAGEGKDYWTPYYIKQNGTPAAAMNEALMPGFMNLYAGWDSERLYLAFEVDADTAFQTADSAWNWYAHLRVFFDPAKTGSWDAVSLRPDANGKYNTLNTVMTHLGSEGKASIDEKTGVATIEIAYKWANVRADGAPKAGDTVQFQVLFAPAADKNTIYQCYLNPIGATAAEQSAGTGNVYPAANWITLPVSGEEMPAYAPARPETAITDVQDGDWYADAARYAVQFGILSAADGKFAADGAMTRGELLSALRRAAENMGLTTAEGDTDAAWAEANGLLADLGTDMTDLTVEISRAEAAAFLARYLTLAR